MGVLILDLEATALDTKQARIIEIGAMFTDDNFEREIAGINTLVWESGYPALTEEVMRVTNINQEMLVKEDVSMQKAVDVLKCVADPRDINFVCAFNVDYDKAVFVEDMRRGSFTMDPFINHIIGIPWICGLRDVESNYKFKSRRLAHLALEYGVTVDPRKLHRAYGDVQLTRKMLHAAGATAQSMQAYQQIPWVVLKAKVGFDDKDKAKAAGFTWQQVHGDDRVYTKQWVKKIKQTDIEKESNYDFRVEQI